MRPSRNAKAAIAHRRQRARKRVTTGGVWQSHERTRSSFDESTRNRSFCGAIAKMSRNLRCRRDTRQDVRCTQVRRQSNRGRAPASSGRCRLSPRLIGLPLSVTVPQIRGIRWRYCARWDEQPAAVLGMSLLRLGICRPEDWTGSAVDFVERGLKRTAQTNGIAQVRKVWQGDLRILDHTFELSEREREEARAEMDAPACKLFLVADFSAAASIPIAPTLRRLEGQ